MSNPMRYMPLLIVFTALWGCCRAVMAQEVPELTVEVLTPSEYQVVQRNASDQGIVPVKIKCDQQVTGAEGRLTLMPGYKGVDTDWTALVATDEPGVYAGNLTAVAGGWYEFQVRVQPAGGEPVNVTVPHIGIGEVFIVAGQSNAANFGEPAQKAQDDRVVSTNGNAWRPGSDPQLGSQGGRGSPWPILGDMLARNLQMPIAFASVAVGGSHSYEWTPAANVYYPHLVNIGQLLGPGGARAVLWHQGESDVTGYSGHKPPGPNDLSTQSEDVFNRMSMTILSLKHDLGWDIPWMVAQASFVPVEVAGEEGYDAIEAAMGQVRRGQELLWERGVALQGPATDDLRGPTYRCDQGGIWIHFSALGLRVHAERWFAMLWAQFYASQPLRLQSLATSTNE